MPDKKSGAGISVPKKKYSVNVVDIRSTERLKKVAAYKDPPAGKTPSKDTNTEATVKLTPEKESEGGEYSDDNPIRRYETSLDQRGRAIVVLLDRGNPYSIPVRSKAFEHRLRRDAKNRGISLRKSDLQEQIEEYEADAEVEGDIINTYHRVAPIPEGIEIDKGCEDQVRYRITANSVEVIKEGSEAIFSRTATMLPLPDIADEGDLTRLNQYLNLTDDDRILFKGLVSYNIGHPKISSSNFPITGMIGGQGTGKSFQSKLFQELIDPNAVGVQAMPANSKDFSIALQNTHVLCIDNIRSIRQAKSDLCCIASTGGTISSRALYTNEDQHTIKLHGALLLNGIHDFIDQSDMAERSVILHPLPIDPKDRKSEAQLKAGLERDMPVILRGFYELISEIYRHTDVKATNPERLIELSDWFARMECVEGVEKGKYQAIYSANLRQAQLNSLLENTLAVAVIQFAESLNKPWNGTPSGLLDELTLEVSRITQRSPNWPQNSIALSKRLKVLQAGLKSQGVFVEFARHKERLIKITTEKIESEY